MDLSFDHYWASVEFGVEGKTPDEALKTCIDNKVTQNIFKAGRYMVVHTEDGAMPAYIQMYDVKAVSSYTIEKAVSDV